MWNVSGLKRLAVLPLLALVVFSAGCGEKTGFISSRLRSEFFTQSNATEKFDFLWVMDNSDSMQENRDFVRNEMDTFIRILNSRKEVDYRMALTTTDHFAHGGMLVEDGSGNAVVDSGSADPVGDFADIVNNIANSGTSFWEWGLESAYQAIAKYGHLFMRDNVPLVIIFLTDEDDYSCASGCFGVEPENNDGWTAHPLSRYTDYFGAQNGVGGDGALVFSIVGTDDTCGGAALGQRYMDLQESMGTGFSGSICDTQISNSYRNIAQYLSDLNTRFPLDENAVPETIKVFVDQVEVPQAEDNGFTYDADDNAIYFNGTAIPPKGSRIEVIYTIPK